MLEFSMVNNGHHLDVNEYEQPFLRHESTRPAYAWENFEDLIYHDKLLDDPDVGTSPELFAFQHQVPEFNRAMRWRRDERDGYIVCFEEGGDLQLSGEGGVSRWLSGPDNTIEHVDDRTKFTRRSDRRRDCIVMRSLEFHSRRHPVVRLEVIAAVGDWQLCVGVKGRSGPPLVASEWQTGAGSVEIDLEAALRDHGFSSGFADLHFVIGTWSDDASAAAHIEFQLQLEARPAIIPALPVIRESGAPAPIGAVVLDQAGSLMGSLDTAVRAEYAGGVIDLQERDGCWSGLLEGLESGEHVVRLVAEGVVNDEVDVVVRITDGRYLSYDARLHQVVDEGRPTGMLTGSYQGSFFFRGVGTAEERLVQGADAWRDWLQEDREGEHQHYWEALTESELEERFSYLAKCGWSLLHLSQHWGAWKKLDVGGRISPHGAEQLALYLRVAARHGLRLIQALSHHPYGTSVGEEFMQGTRGTPPDRRYLEAGFQDDDWHSTGNAFTELFHQYLVDYVALFREETALFGMTCSGEGDSVAGAERVNDTIAFLRSRDPNHVFLAESIFRLKELPEAYTEPYLGDLHGGRTYWVGTDVAPHLDLGVEFKFYRYGRIYLAEGSWAASERYARLQQQLAVSADQSGLVAGEPGTWTGTHRYRLRLRDTIYLAFVHRIPIAMSWDEHSAEDEHRLIGELRRKIDWTTEWREAVAVRVDSDNVSGEGRRVLAQYEDHFASIPLDYTVATTDGPGVVGDARTGFDPPVVANSGPLRLAPGWRANYSWSVDGATLIAYIYNVGETYELTQQLSGRWHRRPVETDFALEITSLPETDLQVSVYDLDRKTEVESGRARGSWSAQIPRTDHDYFVFVRPDTSESGR